MSKFLKLGSIELEESIRPLVEAEAKIIKYFLATVRGAERIDAVESLAKISVEKIIRCIENVDSDTFFDDNSFTERGTSVKDFIKLSIISSSLPG